MAAGSECTPDSSVLAPAGCTQFHFGSQGSVKSFNFEGVQYLNNQVSSLKQTGWVLRIFNLLYLGFSWPSFWYRASYVVNPNQNGVRALPIKNGLTFIWPLLWRIKQGRNRIPHPVMVSHAVRASHVIARRSACGGAGGVGVGGVALSRVLTRAAGGGIKDALLPGLGEVDFNLVFSKKKFF